MVEVQDRVEQVLRELKKLAARSADPEAIALKTIMAVADIVQSPKGHEKDDYEAAPRVRNLGPPQPTRHLVDRAGRLAERAYAARRARDTVFADAELFADPAWDILLDLFISEQRKRPVSITSASIASCVPATTALRWLSLLEARGYLQRAEDDTDKRRAFVRLTDKSRSLLTRYFIETDRRDLS